MLTSPPKARPALGPGPFPIHPLAVAYMGSLSLTILRYRPFERVVVQAGRLMRGRRSALALLAALVACLAR